MIWPKKFKMNFFLELSNKQPYFSRFTIESWKGLGLSPHPSFPCCKTCKRVYLNLNRNLIIIIYFFKIPRRKILQDISNCRVNFTVNFQYSKISRYCLFLNNKKFSCLPIRLSYLCIWCPTAGPIPLPTVISPSFLETLIQTRAVPPMRSESGSFSQFSKK